jgi:DNA-binding SARP family transcriptional activator
MCLRIRLFGIPEITISGKPAPPTRTRKELWLLAYLLLRPDQEVDRTALADLFWPGSDEANARQNLRRSLMGLRDVLGAEAHRLQSPSRTTLRFHAADVWIDVREFDRAAQSHATRDARENALPLYRGPLLEGCLEEWAIPERERRRQSYFSFLESLARDYHSESRFADAARLLHGLLAADPSRESAVCALMEALAAQGDTAAITEVYRTFRQQMHRLLNTEPSEATAALYRRLQKREATVRRDTTLPDSAPARRLPVPLTPLIGREGEITAVRERFERTRLVTLTGTGGVGKTRLAIAVAEAGISDYSEGVWFADLAALTEGTQIPPTVASLFGVRETAGQPLSATLRAALEPKSLLLILDNCEHLRADAAAFAQGMLSACPHLHILATCREPLGVPGEQVFRVPSLPVPSPSDQVSIEKDRAAALLDFAAVRRTGAGRLPTDLQERRSGNGDLSASRRHSLSHRTGRRAGADSVGGTDQRAVRRPVRAAHQPHRPERRHSPSAPSDTAGEGGLEP